MASLSRCSVSVGWYCNGVPRAETQTESSMHALISGAHRSGGTIEQMERQAIYVSCLPHFFRNVKCITFSPLAPPHHADLAAQMAQVLGVPALSAEAGATVQFNAHSWVPFSEGLPVRHKG